MKELIKIVITMAAVLLCAVTLSGQTRRAVVIGLGEQQDASWTKINGDRDVPLVVEMLEANSFSDITTLVNSEATKAAIVKSIKDLTARAVKGDIVYIHFSGHGQRVTDVNGDEADGWDESWIPYDAYRSYCDKDKGEHHLVDDEVSAMLQDLRKRVGRSGCIVVVVDACHSGDSTRGDATDDGLVVRGVFDDFVIPGRHSASTAPIEEQWLTLSACKDFQLNQEYKGVGKLTYILTTQWRSFANRKDNEFLEAIDRLMQSREYRSRYPQSPAMSGTISNVLSKVFSR
ncbi:MAG: caspase family protein [Muribaculaceae bacterium]